MYVYSKKRGLLCQKSIVFIYWRLKYAVIYAAIKNGSYGKLPKAYYTKQDDENLSGNRDSLQKLTLMKSKADSLKKPADALNDTYFRKKITMGWLKMPENPIQKMCCEIWVWMTGMTDRNSNMPAKIGITVGKGKKLELAGDSLKKADISSLKTVFTGYNSFASK